MKNKPFHQRLKFALKGITNTWLAESSFRTQTFLGVGAIVVLIRLHPGPVWWAIFALIIGAVLSAELMNTALENIVDRLHPEVHPLIGRAKDCAAGAVLVLSLTALAILVFLIVDACCK